MNRWFQILGILEGLSFLFLLFVAMPLKYSFELPIAVRVLGPIHGGLFLGYCALAFTLAIEQQWSVKKHLLAYAAAVFPFGTFMFERYRSTQKEKA